MADEIAGMKLPSVKEAITYGVCGLIAVSLLNTLSPRTAYKFNVTLVPGKMRVDPKTGQITIEGISQTASS